MLVVSSFLYIWFATY
ncbi:LpxT activity modulator PmrR [Escherichia coli]